MTINFADILLVFIVYSGVIGSFRGVRVAALTTGAIFFAIVVVLFVGDLVAQDLRRIGVPFDKPDSQAIFKAALFLFTVAMAAVVLRRITGISSSELTRQQKLWGIAVGLLNGFLIMAVIERYIVDAIQASGANISVGIPAIEFAHPDPNIWQVKFVPSTLTLLPTSGGTDLWSKLPFALILLLLFLAVVFIGTFYGRFNRGRSRG